MSCGKISLERQGDSETPPKPITMTLQVYSKATFLSLGFIYLFSQLIILPLILISYVKPVPFADAQYRRERMVRRT